MTWRHTWTQLRKQLWVGFLVLTLCLVAGPASAKTQLEDQVLDIIRKHPDVIIESVQAYQQKQQAEQQQQQQQALLPRLQELHKDLAVLIGDSPVKGSRDRKVVLVEFSDFQCPFCARAHDTVEQFVSKHPEVTFVYKHLPLTQIHPEALPAAQASWAAQQQGKFWEFHDELFAHQQQLGDEFYVETAKKLRLDLNRFNRDRASETAQLAIQKDLNLAERLQLTGTPFFSMNGIPLNGAVPLTAFESVYAQVRANT
ncbi:MAG: thioredoxin domain-containing protein [Synechococcales cyanobacterium]